MADEAFPRLPPQEAIAYLRGKGLKVGFAWQDVWQEEHARAFTVAKAMSRDVLETIRAAIDKALAEGQTLADFRAELTPLLQAKGWWGRRKMVDPATGQARTVQLGSPRRLKVIYETNMRMARAAGRWDQIQRAKSALPYLRYTAVMDERTRPEHREWHGTILPVDDPWWDTHYPPCGWNCRCTVIQLDADTIADRGWAVADAPPESGPPAPYTNPRTGEVVDVPAGIDPGFAYNVGKAWLGGIMPAPLPEPLLPELEPGVGPNPALSPRAPTPATLLAEDVSEGEAVDAFLGAFEPAEPPVPVATINGDELALPDAGIADLRSAARAWLRDQRESPPANPRLGPVRFGKEGIRETIGRSSQTQGGVTKLLATPAIRAVIEHGDVRLVPNRKPEQKPGVARYARITARISLRGSPFDVTVLAEQRRDGWWFYNHEAVEARSGRLSQAGGVSTGGGQRAVGGLVDPESGDRSAADIGPPPRGVEADRTFTDPAGWSLPIGGGWFRDAGGALAVPAGDRRRVLGLVGRAIRTPSEIRLRWVTGADGAPMLFRRYIARVDGLAIIVDVGRAGWRFATERDAGFNLAAMATGELVWSGT